MQANSHLPPPTFLVYSLQAVTNPSVSEGSRESALEACGYMCEQLQEGDLEPQQTNEVETNKTNLTAWWLVERGEGAWALRLRATGEKVDEERGLWERSTGRAGKKKSRN